MSDSRLGHSYCAILNCKSSTFNKSENVVLYHFPTSAEMRSKWLSILKSRCTTIDWGKSRICSNHFERKYIDTQRRLKDNAMPTLFPYKPVSKLRTVRKVEDSSLTKNKLDRLLNGLTQAQLYDDIKNTMQKLKMPDNLSSYINDDLKCQPNTPFEAQLWLLIKKQDHVITRLNQLYIQNKKHVEVLQKNVEEIRSEKKEMEHALENYKYISKCLQEKHATLEEQIEILTAVESR